MLLHCFLELHERCSDGEWAAHAQELLKSLTMGLGVALLTTMVGLVGNILLGLQLTRLDRFADSIVADAQRRGLEVRA
mgnify:CR=1 FL=1